MSVLNQSGEDQAECPLCMEPLEVDDLHFYPCTCGYQICRFCWNRIREGENGLCPACRKAYPENPADFTPLSQEQVAAMKTEKKAREQRRRNKTLESRRALANVRVVQNNLVFVVGLPVRLADPEILKRQEYFGKYGKIHKVVINQSTTYAGSQGPSASAYVTYTSQADALRAIQSVNNVTIDGRVLKGSLGTTKYCANFMKNQPCPKTDCMYLHELGDPKASFTKEEMHQGLHQIYERKLHNQLAAQTQKEQQAAADSKTIAHTSGNTSGFIPTTIVTSSNINIVNSNSKSKQDPSGSWSGSSGSKEAWPSLGSSPPNSDSSGSGSKQNSPKPQDSGAPTTNGCLHTDNTDMSQENGTPESNSPTQSQPKHSKKHNGNTSSSGSSKDQSTNGSNKSNSKSTEHKKWSKQKSNSITEDEEETNRKELERSYLSELDEIESDRHSLLENHDLLDGSDHSLLEDDSHNLLNDTSSDAIMMQRHRDMLASLVDNNHLMSQQIKSNPLVDSFGLLDGYIGSDRQAKQGLMEQKELLLRERSRSEMLMRQNEMMARHHNLLSAEPDHHYLHSGAMGMDGSQLLGAGFRALPPFGTRLDGTVPSDLHNYGIVHGARPAPPAPPALAPQQRLSNGYADPPQSSSEGRYLGENMDKFFNDFHKNQQLKYLMQRSLGCGGREAAPAPTETRGHAYAESRQPAPGYGGGGYERGRLPSGMLSAERLEMEQKQRHQELLAAQAQHQQQQHQPPPPPPPVDDDLDFDPFKETQKALAEMMQSELLQQNGLNSAESMRRARMPPPGFSHMNAFGLGVPRPQPTAQDWTQMDPAIMSTSVSYPHKPPPPPAPLGQQPELFQRFAPPPAPPAGHPLSKLHLLQPGALINGLQNGGGYLTQHKLGWSLPPFPSLPLPPGFAEITPNGGSPAECIESK